MNKKMATTIDRDILSKAVFSREDAPILSDEAIAKALDALKDNEKFVIEQRFTRPFKTLRAIGEIYPRKDGGVGVTKERIRQVEAMALRKLRHPRRLGQFKNPRQKSGQF